MKPIFFVSAASQQLRVFVLVRLESYRNESGIFAKFMADRIQCGNERNSEKVYTESKVIAPRGQDRFKYCQRLGVSRLSTLVNFYLYFSHVYALSRGEEEIDP